MQKFSVGNDTVPYIIKFDADGRVPNMFSVEWLDSSFVDRKPTEDKISMLNSLFKKSIEYYCSGLHPDPSSIYRRYLRKEEPTMHLIFQTMEEVGINEIMMKALLRDLLMAKFELSDAIEALLESNYYVWEKFRKIEDDVRIHKFEFDQLKHEHQAMMIELAQLKQSVKIT